MRVIGLEGRKIWREPVMMPHFSDVLQGVLIEDQRSGILISSEVEALVLLLDNLFLQDARDAHPCSREWRLTPLRSPSLCHDGSKSTASRDTTHIEAQGEIASKLLGMDVLTQPLERILHVLRRGGKPVLGSKTVGWADDSEVI